ncbi:hypothetical protein [Aeromicrobium sp.]|uniref:hypothetical protein n=1 Tax=Aeromicrobium sp. TaxID=1871063 RepID=UPI003C320516
MTTLGQPPPRSKKESSAASSFLTAGSIVAGLDAEAVAPKSVVPAGAKQVDDGARSELRDGTATSELAETSAPSPAAEVSTDERRERQATAKATARRERDEVKAARRQHDAEVKQAKRGAKEQARRERRQTREQAAAAKVRHRADTASSGSALASSLTPGDSQLPGGDRAGEQTPTPSSRFAERLAAKRERLAAEQAAGDKQAQDVQEPEAEPGDGSIAKQGKAVRRQERKDSRLARRAVAQNKAAAKQDTRARRTKVKEQAAATRSQTRASTAAAKASAKVDGHSVHKQDHALEIEGVPTSATSVGAGVDDGAANPAAADFTMASELVETAPWATEVHVDERRVGQAADKADAHREREEAKSARRQQKADAKQVKLEAKKAQQRKDADAKQVKLEAKKAQQRKDADAKQVKLEAKKAQQQKRQDSRLARRAAAQASTAARQGARAKRSEAKEQAAAAKDQARADAVAAKAAATFDPRSAEPQDHELIRADVEPESGGLEPVEPIQHAEPIATPTDDEIGADDLDEVKIRDASEAHFGPHVSHEPPITGDAAVEAERAEAEAAEKAERAEADAAVEAERERREARELEDRAKEAAAEAAVVARREREEAKTVARQERADAKALARSERDEAKAVARQERVDAKALVRSERDTKRAQKDADRMVEPPREPKVSFAERRRQKSAGMTESGDAALSPRTRAAIGVVAATVGAIGLICSVILAVGALMVALGAGESNAAYDLLSSICDALVGPLSDVFTFTGTNGADKEALVAWGLGSMGYLLIGLFAQSVLRSRIED